MNIRFSSSAYSVEIKMTLKSRALRSIVSNKHGLMNFDSNHFITFKLEGKILHLNLISSQLPLLGKLNVM